MKIKDIFESEGNYYWGLARLAFYMVVTFFPFVLVGNSWILDAGLISFIFSETIGAILACVFWAWSFVQVAQMPFSFLVGAYYVVLIYNIYRLYTAVMQRIKEK